MNSTLTDTSNQNMNKLLKQKYYISKLRKHKRLIDRKSMIQNNAQV